MHILYIFLGIIIAVIGVIMLVNPKLFYDITQSWKHNGSTEPSDLFILETKVGGILCLLVGLGVVVIFLFVA